jgi:hypothetical protein
VVFHVDPPSLADGRPSSATGGQWLLTPSLQYGAIPAPLLALWRALDGT